MVLRRLRAGVRADRLSRARPSARPTAAWLHAERHAVGVRSEARVAGRHRRRRRRRRSEDRLLHHRHARQPRSAARPRTTYNIARQDQLRGDARAPGPARRSRRCRAASNSPGIYGPADNGYKTTDARRPTSRGKWTSKFNDNKTEVEADRRLAPRLRRPATRSIRRSRTQPQQVLIDGNLGTGVAGLRAESA